MDRDKKDELIRVMNKVIKQEDLPTPEKILIRTPTRSGSRRMGTCHFKKSISGVRHSYKIFVNTTQVITVPDEKGRWQSRKTGKRFKRVYGVPIPDKEIIETAAHEIGHLKFWRHSPEHCSYTNYINELLLKEIKWELSEG